MGEMTKKFQLLIEKMEAEGAPGVIANKDIFEKDGCYDPKSTKDMAKTNDSLNLRAMMSQGVNKGCVDHADNQTQALLRGLSQSMNNTGHKSGVGLSRKDKAELLEAKLEAIENVLPHLTTKLDEIYGDLYNYKENVVKRIDVLEEDKIWKKDLPDLMPT